MTPRRLFVSAATTLVVGVSVALVPSPAVVGMADRQAGASRTAPSPNVESGTLPRRDLLLGASAAALSAASQFAFVAPASAAAASSPPPPPAMMGRGGVPGPRVEGIGGGFDVLSPPPLSSPDVVYPASLLGTWRVQRVRTATDGDLGQAGVAWRLMGGGDEIAFAREIAESHDVRYVEAPEGIDASYDFEGKAMRGVVLDRGYELSSRKGTKFASDVRWDVGSPGVLRYVDGFGEPVQLAVVQRRVEKPSEAGFGSDELVRITASAGGLLGSAGGPVVRAARVRRRFRRAFDDEGNRIVEGLEIVTTYRVLDGVAGVEMPTSTTKSRIRMSRKQQ